MKDAFPEFFVEEPSRQQKLWETCLFVLDTNVLLDLYRFSDSSRDALFKVMESLGDRLWIPYQVAQEYFDNRLKVIEDQTDAYAKSINGLKAAKEKFNSGSRHPFVSELVFNKFIESYDLMLKELQDNKRKYLSFIEEDVIKARIGTLLNGKVGRPYSIEQLQDVAVEGEVRYLENIPPGFQDGGKMPEATTDKLKLKKFGDLILWKQIIDKAVEADKSVILVTGEKKDDWWLKSDKTLVGALPALSKEFMLEVNKDFYLYATDAFLLKANDYLAQDTSDVVVEEVRAINKADADLASEFDQVLLDKAVNANMPLAEFMRPIVAGSIGNWWRHHTPTRANQWVNDETTDAQLDLIREQRIFVRQRATVLRTELDSLRTEHESLTKFSHNLMSSGVGSEDKTLINARHRLIVLDTLIGNKEEELALLRSQVIENIKLQNSLLDDGGE